MIGTPEEQRPRVGKFLEIEAPEKLMAGQNFLDQEPFRSAIEQSVQSSGLPMDHLRRVFIKTLKKEDAVRDYQYFVYRGLFNALFKGPSLKAEFENRERYYQAVSNMLSSLAKYPFVPGYFVNCFDADLYGDDGTWNITGRQLPESLVYQGTYAKWVTDKLKRQGNLRLIGIEEVFPQDFAGQSPSVPPIGQGSRSSNRRWRIVEASNIVRDKR